MFIWNMPEWVKQCLQSNLRMYHIELAWQEVFVAVESEGLGQDPRHQEAVEIIRIYLNSSSIKNLIKNNLTYCQW